MSDICPICVSPVSDATGGYTIVARCETISAFLDKPLKPLMNRLKKELSNNTLEIDLTEENTDLNLMDALEIAHGETKIGLTHSFLKSP